MSRARFTNLHRHPEHNLFDVLRWQLGFAPKDTEISPALVPDSESAREAAFSAVERRPNTDPIQLTWIGHSTFLIHHRGRFFLTDPIFGNCDPPLPLKRLRRLQPPGLALPSLPPVNEVLISHCHYDHLDAATVARLGRKPRYWLPERLGEWFTRRGKRNIRELAWWQSARLADDLEITCVPAQHFAARSPFDRDKTHWCGWVIRSGDRSIYFAGDTGYCPVFREIGSRFGGFDLALIPIGAYCPRWLMRPMHVNPQEAVQIHLDVRSQQSVACHWGTFALTDEPPDEPPAVLRTEMLRKALDPRGFRALAIGETIEV